MSEPPITNEPLPQPDEIQFIPQAHSRPIHSDSWFERNLRPLLLIAVALTLMLAFTSPPLKAPAQAQAPHSPIPDYITLHQIAHSPVLLLNLAVLGIGFLASIVLLTYVYTAATPKQSWLQLFVSKFSKFSIRPLPALRIPDLVALLVVLSCAGSILPTCVVAIYRAKFGQDAGGGLSEDIQATCSLILMVLMMAMALGAAVWLARERGNGRHGSQGVWPFWQRSSLNTPVTIWRDIGLGLLTYFLTAWVILLVNLINAWCVTKLGLPEDHHRILDIIEDKPSALMLVTIAISAAISAPFFEELLFRGVLYNVLRRYLGGWTGAIGAAFIFSIAHGIKSNILSLWLIGLILTWLYERTGRLVASMTFHFINNAMSLVLLWNLTSGKG